ncbi:bifunctional DNA primase/polymerase [Haloechinothrix sp. LS1_15]|uniref:bifunctional DNA primase/polymerase n=1 Tax=Haloechinothrix sp. LS1_15 TaxID=2652248 RepID=UPI002944115D|nr:bifunctional DNA primase/polymerase [Haloechinothrix sp. LS1_15]MDV6011364.1 bifunctional DNA primase/polymerase [Haloechinothrix sp. LS1_15]
MLDTVGWRDAFRIELRAAAIGLASRGWPVVPGTYRGASTEGSPVPVRAGWVERHEPHPQRIAGWWATHPYSVLVATGSVVDAVEVDDELGRMAATLLRAAERPAPIMSMPNGKWLYLTEAGRPVPDELAERAGVRWHGEGSFVPVPPTPFEHGVVHWRVKPEIWEWKLPHPAAVHGILVRALRAVTTGVTELAEDTSHPVGTSAA